MTNHDNSGVLWTFGNYTWKIGRSDEAELSQVELRLGLPPCYWWSAFENGTTKMTGSGAFCRSSHFDIFRCRIFRGNPNQDNDRLNSLRYQKRWPPNSLAPRKKRWKNLLKMAVLIFKMRRSDQESIRISVSREVGQARLFSIFFLFKQMLGEGVHWVIYNASYLFTCYVQKQMCWL